MGGNAIPKARRVSKEEYDATIKHIEGQSYHVSSNEVYQRRHIWIVGQVVKSYRQKQDFGDIDVVIDDRVDIVDIFTHYRPKKCAVNGNVMSIAYDSIQVDFIRTPKEYIQTTLDYFAYNDLGNLLGKIARSLGFKYGNKGLIYQYKEGNNVIEDIQVETVLEDILAVFGLDSDRYNQGFDTMEDIFKFIASSEFFHPELYALENASTANRIRDSKRKTYQAFLEWIKSQSFPERSSVASRVSERVRHAQVFECYSHIQERIDVLNKEREQDKLFRESINGAVISELTGLTGAELGQFIERFRQLHTKDEILKLTGPEVRKLITDTFKFFKHKEKENG
jgi:hypothetical protein